MSFAQIENITATSFATDRTSYNVACPSSVDADNLLLMVFACDGNTAHGVPTGWTMLASDTYGNQATTSIYMKVAVGDEGGTFITCSSSASESGAAQIYNIYDWNGATAGVEINTVVEASSSAPNAGAIVASWGSEDNLFVNLMGAGDDDVDATSGPSGWTSLVTLCGGGSNVSGSVYSAYVESASDTGDPGAWNLQSSERYQAYTLVVRTGTAGGPVAGGAALGAIWHHRHMLGIS